MTREEAISLIQTAKAEMEWEHPLEYAEAFEKAIQDIGNREKYKWHDLKKNPEDLPIMGELVEVVYEYHLRNIQFHEITTLDYYNHWEASADYDMKYWSVIAWRYIEPFEEDE